MERSLSQAYSLHPAKAVDGVLELLDSEAKAKPYRDRRCFDEKGLSSSASA
jgi:hypothetical protein